MANVQIDEGEDKHMFKRHVQSRWMTLSPAVSRVLEQLSVLKKYFCELPKNQKGIEKNERFVRIRKSIVDPVMEIQMKFIVAIAPAFDRFLSIFQNEGPLIHCLYKEMCTTLRAFLMRFIKMDIVNEVADEELDHMDIEKPSNILPDDEIDVGNAVRCQLIKLPHQAEIRTMLNMKEFFACGEIFDGSFSSSKPSVKRSPNSKSWGETIK